MYGIHIKKFLVLILHDSLEHAAHVWTKTGGDYNNNGLERRLFCKISNRTSITAKDRNLSDLQTRSGSRQDFRSRIHSIGCMINREKRCNGLESVLCTVAQGIS